MNIDMNIDVNTQTRAVKTKRQVRIRNVAGIRIIIAIAFAHIRYWICHCGRDRPRVGPARIDRDRAAGASRPRAARATIYPNFPSTTCRRAGAGRRRPGRFVARSRVPRGVGGVSL